MEKFSKIKTTLALTALSALVAAQTSTAGLQIPPDQPVCRLYGLIQVFGTVAGVIVAAYAGFILASSHEIEGRNSAKNLIAGAVMGLVIIWLAPLVVKSLVGATDVCGW
ncbi:Uncharacterised protein [Candidatus Gugararchaeum adminiculabundum]|nr:Uncharacterised protein [Candidatus Gugararchaeum adminiculabundum]